jgi:hypothetical protein
MRARAELTHSGHECEYCGCPETFDQPYDSNCLCDCHRADPDDDASTPDNEGP